MTEGRKAYALFREGRIAGMKLPNRFVRSATADSLMHRTLRVSDEDVAVYRNLARGGVGLIVTGGFHVTPPRFAREEGLAEWDVNYDEVRIQGINRLVDSVRTENPNCRIVAQLQTGGVRGRPSSIPSPFSKKVPRELGVREIRVLIDAFAESIRRMKEEGFDGAQLHAGHGTVLCRFFSLYTNRRTDAYGGSTEKRLRIAREIVEHAREVVGDFPILIKANGTDYVESGTDLASFPDVARELKRIGFDAIEITGGMWECLARSQEELGFRPVPAPESHTEISAIENQSYFLPYAETVDLEIPIILSGGNRNVERMEEIVTGGATEFVSMCRPLIREPELVNRWRAGCGGEDAMCIACNSCIYELWYLADRPEFSTAVCLYERDKMLHREAQQWLATWVEEHRTDGRTA